MNIIGFTGLAGSGKSTAANHLVEKFGAVRLSFAQPIRDMLLAIGVQPSAFTPEGKASPCALLGDRTPRYAMQTLGTQWGREMIDPNIWLNILRERVRAARALGRVVVIDDVRFENEADVIRSIGGIIFSIERAGLVRGDHPSEAGIPEGKISFGIKNDRTVEHMLSLVEDLARLHIDPAGGFFTAVRKDWTQTFTGKQFFPTRPTAESICIEDIAHALSNLCRFAGHVRAFYSVAQHSILVASLLPEELQLAGLLHDATEAYLVDVPQPLKLALPQYREIENRLSGVIEAKYGVSFADPAVKRADLVMLATEARDLMGPPPAPWHLTEAPTPAEIIPLQPAEARARFISLFYHLMDRRAKAA